MDGDVRTAVEDAAQQVLNALQEGVEDTLTAAVTNLRDRCNEFLGEDGDEGVAAPEQLPAE